ncbi:unnamed protein product [Schistosoma margrebowiei]|uniref:Uncharacterized protein n=1 Tax=Schistosoma margrebowiei TaxID=48269 RepID=A0A183LIZ2_9TREM|nr:unnamed protein product [Schistosoma margrebowiei]
MLAGDRHLVHTPFVSSGSWNSCAQLVWNEGSSTPLGALSVFTNPFRAPEIFLSFPQFRKKHLAGEGSEYDFPGNGRIRVVIENDNYNYESFKHLKYPTIMKDIEDDCEKCDRKKCPPIIQCNVGTVRDKCGCCDICALEEAQLCNIPEDFKNGILKQGITWHGICGTDLECRTRTDIDSKIIGSQSICYCVKPGKVCGSDGVTYSKCKMNATIISSNGKIIPISEGPCQTAHKQWYKEAPNRYGPHKSFDLGEGSDAAQVPTPKQVVPIWGHNRAFDLKV